MADSLLSEVDADLRAERIEQLWRRYRLRLLALVIAIIVATAAYTFWERYEQKRGGALLQQFVAAQALYDQGKFPEAADAFGAIASHATHSTLTLAELWQARALSAADKKPDAIELLKKASLRGNGLWSDLACLRLASLDAASASCLTKKADSPLLSERREWQAATQWAAGDRDGAIAMLEQLATSPDTSDVTRSRVLEWLATIREQKSGQ